MDMFVFVVLDVLGTINHRFGITVVRIIGQPVRFVTPEEPLRRGIVHAIATQAQAMCDLVTPQQQMQASGVLPESWHASNGWELGNFMLFKLLFSGQKCCKKLYATGLNVEYLETLYKYKISTKD